MTLDEPATINLLITEQCNFACDHCMFSCSIKNDREYMSNDTLSHVVRWYNEIDQQGSVNIVGGEPTLNMKECKRIVEYLYRHDVRMEMTTNGWWLRSVKHIKKVVPILQMIIDNGGMIRISDSDFHRPFRKGEDNYFEFRDELMGECEGRVCIECASSIENDYCDCCKEEVDDWEYVTKDEDGMAAIARIDHFFEQHELYVDKQSSHGEHISSTGRAKEQFIGWQKPSCFDSNPIVTLRPNGDIRDLCCNGGYFPAGHISNNNLTDLFETRVELVDRMKSNCVDCAGCKSFAMIEFGAHFVQEKACKQELAAV